ncbi:Imm8 family immunity protein [Paenibacillus tyrfis]|uniref:Imm8 family immunity protein n=1 Tax=Paenibacillus tyrfis TaxID=1501230 RepID=UPI0015C5A83E|nr:Imm8 family immunity protein [Paenibacillus tyrfis]
MIKPSLKFLGVVFPPDSDDDFWVVLSAEIGEEGSKGVDVFYFNLTTPKRLMYVLQNQKAVFKRGLIIVDKYDYETAKKIIEDIILECRGETWQEVRSNIMKYCMSEYGD